VIAREPRLAAPASWYLEARQRIGAAAATVSRWRVPRVLAGFVVAQWILVLALGLTVRHAGWIYYQGGDQLWYYTLGWLLGHGQLTQTPVGYGWSFMLAPLSRIVGPNLVAAFPAIILFNVLVLLPVAMFALYGIASRIGGRLFGYWALLLWLVVPFIGIVYTNTGYHQRYTELTLPQAFGLTAMSDFPTMVAALVSLYFVARIVLDRAPTIFDGVAGGVAAGAAIAIKPSTALFLAGPVLAFAYRRTVVPIAGYAAGLAPALLALAVWKERGLGKIPLLGAPDTHGQLAAAAPIVALDLGRYLNIDWQRFLDNLDLLREHFWSNRLIEWLVLAGVIALFRRSRGAALLVGGTFAAFAVVKGGYGQASIEDSSTFRILMPAYPCFILLLAALPYLLPHVASRAGSWSPAFAPLTSRVRWSLVACAIAVSAVLPLAAFAAASRNGGLVPATIGTTIMPIPANVDLGLRGAVRNGQVHLAWKPQSSFGGPVFYRIWRGRRDGLTCPAMSGGKLCNITLPEIRVSRASAIVDRPASGRWVYRVAVAANWLNDPNYGDPYFVSRPLALTVP
jgi:hypothetical protein